MIKPKTKQQVLNNRAAGNQKHKESQTHGGHLKHRQTRLVKRINLRTGEITEEEEFVRSRITY